VNRIIYVLEGSLEYQVEGQPPTTYKAGDVLLVPAGVIHAVRNVGSSNAAELATYVVERASRSSRRSSERQPLR
jgi:quercetin dioxygenase-like cupin family protein